MSYDDERQNWSPFDRAQTAAADLRLMLSMRASKDTIRTVLGPSNYARTFEYLDCIDKNLPVLQSRVRELIELVIRLSNELSASDAELVARARIEAGLIRSGDEDAESAGPSNS